MFDLKYVIFKKEDLTFRQISQQGSRRKHKQKFLECMEQSYRETNQVSMLKPIKIMQHFKNSSLYFFTFLCL